MADVRLSTGISMFYNESGEGEPLLFVSGQNTDHTQWATVTPRYVDTYRIIVFDTRGTGSTDKPVDAPYSMRDFAADVVALLDALAVERAHIIGASMGGKITQQIAIDYPERVASAVLMATTPGGPHAASWDAQVARTMKSVPTGDAATDPILPLLVSELWAGENPDFAQNMAERRMNPGGPVPRRLHFQASQEHNAWESLPSITTPVLVVHGADDRISPVRNAELLASRIPAAELAVIEHGRHEFFVEYPKETTRIVRDFLARHSIQ